MLPQENTLVGEDAAAGVRRLSACAEPVEGSLGVDLDGCGIGVLPWRAKRILTAIVLTGY